MRSFALSQVRYFALEPVAAKSYSALVRDEQKINDAFRAALKRIREGRGLDMKALSLKAGLNKRAVTDIENGASQSPKLSTVIALADALEVSPLVLIGREPAHEIVKEWQDFLEGYSEAQQRRFLAAVQSLQIVSDE